MPKNEKPEKKRRKLRPPGIAHSFLAAPKLPKHEWRLVFGQKSHSLQTAHFKRWQLQEAKAKFSELFDRTLSEGPQVVTRHNKQAVVMLPEEQYRKLAEGPAGSQPGMLETLLKCPKGPDLKLPQRDKTDSILDLPDVFD